VARRVSSWRQAARRDGSSPPRRRCGRYGHMGHG
jgi:hypothetical protein